ncbi:MAG: hypothetical protein GHHEDOFH_02932 [Pseudorhodoplanes sp.]|nr:hypothetical protein [Pseudorhodoplanes sp.]
MSALSAKANLTVAESLSANDSIVLTTAGMFVFASARSNFRPAPKVSTSASPPRSTLTGTIPGNSKIKRVKVGCTPTRTRTGFWLRWLIWRCSRMCFSASRARRASSSMTLLGRPGATPVQFSGSRSMNSHSPAAIELTVTLRASAMRMPVPSGSRRAAPT